MFASPPLILGKSRVRKRARTDLCGGRSVMVVPTGPSGFHEEGFWTVRCSLEAMLKQAEGHWLLIFKRASIGIARLRASNARSSSVSADRLLLKLWSMFGNLTTGDSAGSPSQHRGPTPAYKHRFRISKRRQKSGTISQFPGVRERAHSDATAAPGGASLVCWANGRFAHSRGLLWRSWPVESGRSF